MPSTYQSICTLSMSAPSPHMWNSFELIQKGNSYMRCCSEIFKTGWSTFPGTNVLNRCIYKNIYYIYICGDFHLFLFSNEFVDLHYIGMNVDETSWSCEYVYAFENTCTRWVRTFALVYSTLLAMLHVWQRWPLAKALLWGFLLRGWPEFVLLASV